MALIGKAVRGLGRGVNATGRFGGRAASWTGRGVGGHLSRHPAPYVVGGGIVGGMSALTDDEGVYRQQIYPRVQESITGDPNAINNMMRANIWAAWNPNPLEQRQPQSYLYGQPINPQAMKDRRTARGGSPVSGEVVFGMYNMRR